jgi:hypothetical protein
MQTTVTSPSATPAEDVSPPRARRLPGRAHLALPGVLTLLFAFRAGGFFPLLTGAGALALCLLLVGRVTLADRPFSGWSRAAAVAGLAGAGYASWTLLSATWSHAPERALVEFDRALLYTILMVLMASFPRRPGDLTIVLRWVLLALVAACVAGLASRLAADAFPTSSRYYAERLSFPVTYWNALGLACGIATVLALHHGSGEEEPRWVRIAATAALPITITTLYFSFSRGGMAVCGLGVVAYLLLGPSRRLLFTLAAGLVPVAVALWAAYRAGTLATAHYFRGDGPAQGHRLALVIAGCVLAAAVLRALAGRLERRMLRRPGPDVSRGTAIGLAVLVLLVGGSAAVVAGVPGFVRKEVRTFTSGQLLGETGDARDRLLSGSSNGRLQLWQTSLDSFSREPLHGTGAGTFRLEWQQHRPYFQKVGDGHSLYIEVMGELGLVGLVLVLVLVVAPVGVALGRLRGPQRQAHAAFAAASLALLVHAGVDWDWEMPVVFAWFFGAAGVVLARPPAADAAVARLGRLTRIVAGLACLVLAITPAIMALSQSRLDRAFAAFRQRDCTTAVDAALAASEALPRAQASEIIGYCDLRARQDRLAIRAMQAARARDPENWQYAYGLAIAEAISGQDPRAAANEALRLDPREADAQSLARAMASRSAKARFAAAAHAVIPSE